MAMRRTNNGQSGPQLNVAIIGCGRIGEREAEAVVSIPALRLVAVADIGPAFRDKALRMGSKYECDAVHEWGHLVARPDVDIVVVATPNSFHRDISIEAMENGKHVLVEKPLAVTVLDAEEMLVTARREGVKLMTNFNHRRHDHNLRAKQLLEQGLIGRPVLVRGRIGHGRFMVGPSPAGGGRFQCVNTWYMEDAQSGGGTLIDNGVHLLDLVSWFMADEFVEAQGMVTRNMDLCERQADGSVKLTKPNPCEDNAFGHLKTRDGRLASIHSSWVQWYGYLHIEIFGTHGAIVINNDQIQGQVTCQSFTRHGDPIATTIEVPALLKPDPSWRLQLEEFMSAIRDDREPSPNGEDGLRVLRMVHALYRSAALGTIEPIDAEEAPKQAREEAVLALERA
jgi:predicted dehydrogenase